MNGALVFSVLIVNILRHDLHLAASKVLAAVLERWSPMGHFVIDDWVRFPMRYKELRQIIVDVDIPVGLGQGVEIVKSEKRYIKLTRPRLELMHVVWRRCTAAMVQLT